MSDFKRIFDIIHYYRDHYAKPIMVGGRKGDSWKTVSTAEFVENMDYTSKGLLAKGIKKGDRVGLMSGNRPEWNMIDFATNQIGAAIVPFYPTLSSKDLAYIIQDSEVKLLFVSNNELFSKINDAISENNLDVDIYTIDDVDGQNSLKDLIAIGKAQDIDLKPFNDAVDEEDLLTLIYTSGTTGTPKGVYLSHKNILSNVHGCQHLVPDGCEKSISFLPLSHIFERMVVYLYFSRGIQIWYAESLDNIVVDINEVKPQFFTTVPRVLEKVYDKIVAKGKSLTGIKKALFFWALDLGHKYQEPTKNSAWYNFRLGIARKLIFSKWRDALGGEVRFIISGGAALQERLARVFWAADIRVLEGYGLTETSPVISVNSTKDTGVKFGSVGKVLGNLDVKIAEDGEILVKGPSISKGYYKNDKATAEVFDEHGYFHTGDIGELTADGFLRITDRKKEMFKTAGGKYVAPQVLENKLMESPFIGQVMVIGENRRFPSALIVPNFEDLEKWAERKNISFSSREELIAQKEVLEKYDQIVDNAMTKFGKWEKVKKFVLLPEEWTIDNGELTPKLSLRRKVILEKFQKAVDEIYAEEE
ncbi:AMP-dependent synthetase/ligase [Sphingobacterium corticibacter]|uniref:Long-chain fatty acid--CoA ligase n=1 Tax=Sphingobacterium corticibacter TaxID=2171749 RepID=A0A2T8HLV5_9SPHI|nr:long-chain fatty acid--CoA ligase [Sphingobacterium corticibacter]PVH26416.1 long-chain fatty acid--CoA ligase [Sphingobacterium corticibacter]